MLRALVYQGQWVDGRREGLGDGVWEDAKYGMGRFNGRWKGGKPEGVGQWLSTEHLRISSYVGHYRDGKRQGLGKSSEADSSYLGWWHGNLPSGYGQLTLVNNIRYQGGFKEGKPDGYGVIMDVQTGWVHYRGGFSEGKRSGFGVAAYPRTKLQYSGMWSDGFHTGKGSLTHLSSGTVVFEGEFRFNAPEGEDCTLRSKRDGSLLYQGRFLAGVPHGEGKLFSPDGSVFYSGSWLRGLYHGIGALTRTTPSSSLSLSCVLSDYSHAGQFFRGLKDGRGTTKYTFLNSSMTGHWVQDVLTASTPTPLQLRIRADPSGNPLSTRRSKPIYTFRDGSHLRADFQWEQKRLLLSELARSPKASLSSTCSVLPSLASTEGSSSTSTSSSSFAAYSEYRGYTLFGKPSAVGEMRYFVTDSEPEVYLGEWLNGARHGFGVYYTPRKKVVYRGQWKFDVRHGTGLTLYQNGDFYMGQFCNDHREGYGVLYSSKTNTMIMGEFSAGNVTGRNGPSIFALQPTPIPGLSFFGSYTGCFVDAQPEGPGTLSIYGVLEVPSGAAHITLSQLTHPAYEPPFPWNQLARPDDWRRLIFLSIDDPRLSTLPLIAVRRSISARFTSSLSICSEGATVRFSAALNSAAPPDCSSTVLTSTGIPPPPSPPKHPSSSTFVHRPSGTRHVYEEERPAFWLSRYSELILPRLTFEGSIDIATLLPCGKGSASISGGLGVYEGDWKDGFFEGLGVLTTEHFVFSGAFFRSLRHGEGRFLNVMDGSVYLGSWNFDLQLGTGLYVWPTGDLTLEFHHMKDGTLLRQRDVAVDGLRKLIKTKNDVFSRLLVRFQVDWDPDSNNAS